MSVHSGSSSGWTRSTTRSSGSSTRYQDRRLPDTTAVNALLYFCGRHPKKVKGIRLYETTYDDDFDVRSNGSRLTSSSRSSGGKRMERDWRFLEYGGMYWDYPDPNPLPRPPTTTSSSSSPKKWKQPASGRNSRSSRRSGGGGGGGPGPDPWQKDPRAAAAAAGGRRHHESGSSDDDDDYDDGSSISSGSSRGSFDNFHQGGGGGPFPPGPMPGMMPPMPDQFSPMGGGGFPPAPGGFQPSGFQPGRFDRAPPPTSIGFPPHGGFPPGGGFPGGQQGFAPPPPEFPPQGYPPQAFPLPMMTRSVPPPPPPPGGDDGFRMMPDGIQFFDGN